MDLGAGSFPQWYSDNNNVGGEINDGTATPQSEFPTDPSTDKNAGIDTSIQDYKDHLEPGEDSEIESTAQNGGDEVKSKDAIEKPQGQGKDTTELKNTDSKDTRDPIDIKKVSTGSTNDDDDDNDDEGLSKISITWDLPTVFDVLVPTYLSAVENDVIIYNNGVKKRPKLLFEMAFESRDGNRNGVVAKNYSTAGPMKNKEESISKEGGNGKKGGRKQRGGGGGRN